MIHYAHRRWVRSSHAAVPLDDVGFQFGLGVFTTLLIAKGDAVFLQEHLERLAGDAHALGIRCPSHRLIAAKLAEGIARNGLQGGVVKIIVTGGGADFGEPSSRARLYLKFEAPRRPWRAVHLLLVPVVPSPWRRHKTTAYLDSVHLRREAVACGCHDGIAVEAGDLLECAGANLFVVRGAQVMTPPLDGRILPGIARGKLVASGVAPVTERPLSRAHLRVASEVFLTNCTRGITPVGRVSDRQGRVVWQSDGRQTITRRFARFWAAALVSSVATKKSAPAGRAGRKN